MPAVAEGEDDDVREGDKDANPCRCGGDGCARGAPVTERSGEPGTEDDAYGA